MERQENKDVAAVIRKLDKGTLNLYTPVRAGNERTELDRPCPERVKAGAQN